jgi:hypothetical protein
MPRGAGFHEAIPIMRCIKAFSAVALSAVIVVVFTACGGVRFNPPTSTPTPGNPGGSPLPAGPPVVVSPEKLAEELVDDKDPAAFSRWTNKLLQVEGVVREHSVPSNLAPGDRRIHGVIFKVMVTDKRGAKVERQIVCHLETPVPPEDAKAARLAVGKTVTVRGKLTSQSGRFISLGYCTFE